MTAWVINQAARSGVLFCGVAPVRGPTKLELKHEPHLVLGGCLVLVLAFLVAEKVVAVITDFASDELSSGLDWTTTARQVRHHVDAVPVNRNITKLIQWQQTSTSMNWHELGVGCPSNRLARGQSSLSLALTVVLSWAPPILLLKK